MKNIYLFSHEVLMRDGIPTEGAIELIRYFSVEKQPFLILTDHSLHSRSWMADRMYENGFPLFSKDLFYTSTMASVDEIRSHFPERNRAAVIGSDAMKDLVQKGGFILDQDHPHWLFIGSQRDATFRDYSQALRGVMSGATIISVSDKPVEMHHRLPQLGAGSIAMMMEYASGTEALVAGWSSASMINKALGYIGATPDQALFVSDNLDVEIATAVGAHIDSIYVLGSNRNVDLNSSDVHPTYVVDSLNGLFM